MKVICKRQGTEDAKGRRGNVEKAKKFSLKERPYRRQILMQIGSDWTK